VLGLRESDLVAARLPRDGSWAALLGEAWDAGAAVLPIDDRLPAVAVDDLLERARPTVWLDGSSVARRPDGVPVEDGIGLVMATSGSSGEPRLVSLPHAAVGAAVAASVERLAAGSDDPWLLCLPVAHMGGMLVLLRARALGAPLLVGDFEPGAAFASIVPTQLARAVSSGVDLSGFRALLVGGAALDPALLVDGAGLDPAAAGLEPAAAAARALVVTTYGQTESCGGVVYDGVPLDGVSIRIGPAGEIELAGPTLMRGYRLSDDSPLTDDSPFTGDGWLRTGDAGALLEDGRLVVHGRMDDAIVTGGEKVWPAEVERVLRACPSVADVAVTGRPDAEWGSVVVAYVVPHDPAAPPALEQLRALCASVVAAYKAPRALIIVEQLPRTASGKVARATLR